MHLWPLGWERGLNATFSNFIIESQKSKLF